MHASERDQVLSILADLEDDVGHDARQQVEQRMRDVIELVLAEDGYAVKHELPGGDRRSDLVAEREPGDGARQETIGVEFKVYRGQQSIPLRAISQSIVFALTGDFDRLIFFGNRRFTSAARRMANQQLPLVLELLDLDALRAWIARIKVTAENADLVAEAKLIMSATSRHFAALIAREPGVLDVLEWRDMERVLAEIFDELGFVVELTPGSGDQGKDLILECVVRGRRCTYIVEVKHWRGKSRVGAAAVKSFLQVVLREERDGGVFLSTYGYYDNAFEELTEIDRQRIRIGGQSRVVSLCRTFTKAESGLWTPPSDPAKVLYEATE